MCGGGDAAAGRLPRDMQDQPKFVPQRGSDFYPDGRSARPQVENTGGARAVASGHVLLDRLGPDGKEGNAMPSR